MNVIGFLAYAFNGIGKFASTFLPWHSQPIRRRTRTVGLILMAITTLYVVKGGMFSVVFTEVMQFSILTTASIISVGIIAMRQVTPEMLATSSPPAGTARGSAGTLDLDWSQLMPAVNQQHRRRRLDRCSRRSS